MRILIACEFSGRVREAFRARGHDAWSCDLLPSELPGPHYCGPVQHLLNGWMPVTYAADCIDDLCPRCGLDFADCPHPGPTQDGYEYRERVGVMLARPLASRRWDMIIAYPPCTHTAISGAKHFAAKRADGRQQSGIDFFMLFTQLKCPRVAIEHPISIMSSVYRKPDQIVQPFWFGDEARKPTCLWLKGLPLLVPTNMVGEGEFHVTKGGNRLPKWYNLPPSPNRSKLRSATFPGFAAAMAAQWG